MTDLVTGNQIDIAAFDSGMSDNDKKKQLRGTQFADWVERGVQSTLTSAVSGIQAASREQEGWHDDALRGIGTGAKWLNRKWQEGTADQEGIGDDILRSIGGGAKNTMRVLDAASYYGGKIGGRLSEAAGFDPRIGGALGNVAGEALTGFGAKKALQIGKYIQKGDALQDLARVVAPEDSLYRMMLDTGGGVVSPPKRKVLSKNIFKGEADRRFNRIAHMEQKTLNTFRDKAGSDIAYKDLASKVDKAYEHYERTGGLKGMEGGAKWINPETGEAFIIKGKMAANQRITLGVDSIKSTEVTKALREASAKIPDEDVFNLAKELKIPNHEEVAQAYINRTKLEHKVLKKLIRDLNTEAGRKTWSLGHGRAVKALRDKGLGHADMFTNIELERLVNLLDDKGNVLVRGNSSRAASDELADVVNTALNRSETLREDLLKFHEKDLSQFWPQMGSITDEASFIRESTKRDAFVNAVERVYKETGDWSKSVNSVLQQSGTMGVRGTPKFKPKSIYDRIYTDLYDVKVFDGPTK